MSVLATLFKGSQNTDEFTQHTSKTNCVRFLVPLRFRVDSESAQHPQWRRSHRRPRPLHPLPLPRRRPPRRTRLGRRRPRRPAALRATVLRGAAAGHGGRSGGGSRRRQVRRPASLTQCLRLLRTHLHICSILFSFRRPVV
jgi:hypothetical protein